MKRIEQGPAHSNQEHAKHTNAACLSESHDFMLAMLRTTTGSMCNTLPAIGSVALLF